MVVFNYITRGIKVNHNIIGLILSYVFVFSVILLSTAIQYIFKLSTNFSRKIIHIAVGNWIFIALYYFSNWYFAIIGPASFILINYISYRFNIFKAMELEEKNPGTVYYSISLTILTFITFIRSPFYIFPYLGIMAMTWGDGFAAVIGKKFPVKIIRAGKSIGGSITFFLFTIVSCIIYLFIQNTSLNILLILAISITFAFVGMLIELFSPKNMDNFTVPLILGLSGLLLELLI